ncbi:unnamed protein product [Rhizophagus irregularis]|nr:unnamed protein product [Rhizophagus irregularis]
MLYNLMIQRRIWINMHTLNKLGTTLKKSRLYSFNAMKNVHFQRSIDRDDKFTKNGSRHQVYKQYNEEGTATLKEPFLMCVHSSSCRLILFSGGRADDPGFVPILCNIENEFIDNNITTIPLFFAIIVDRSNPSIIEEKLTPEVTHSKELGNFYFWLGVTTKPKN